MVPMTRRHAIVIFDGECSFCSSSVQFIIRHDPQSYFKFCPSQSETAEQIRQAYDIANVTGTMILIQDNVAYTHSDAVLRIASRLNAPWKFARVFLIVPGCIRNTMYRFVSANRKRLPGKKTACMMPTDDVRARFEIADEDWR